MCIHVVLSFRQALLSSVVLFHRCYMYVDLGFNRAAPRKGGLTSTSATGGSRGTLPLRHLNNTRLAPIVARNVIFATRRTATMASKQLLSPLRRAVLQKVRPNASICVQCQRRWQSKVSQRPGSDRYVFKYGRCLAIWTKLTALQCPLPRCSQQ